MEKFKNLLADEDRLDKFWRIQSLAVTCTVFLLAVACFVCAAFIKFDDQFGNIDR